jgi:RNA polymerase sigma-70 factor (ECF subfamily)
MAHLVFPDTTAWRLGREARHHPERRERLAKRGTPEKQSRQPVNRRSTRRRIDGISGPPQNPTALLLAWNQGDPDALEALLPLVYEELRQLAGRYMKGERSGHTLQATALVNEVYVRLIDLQRVRWQNRAHFFAMAARLMRRILVEAARSRDSQKRGGGAPVISLDEALVLPTEPGSDLVALDEALTALAAVDSRKSQVVEMRFFGGLSLDETAEALHVSRDTVKRDWKMAKLWLLRELQRGRT